MANTNNLKSWSVGSLWNLLRGYALHGTQTVRETREMRAAKDELKRRGVPWSEIKAGLDALAA